MSETIYAFLALMLVLFYTMDQQREIVDTERELAGIELEVMALAVGQDLMHTISARHFDEGTKSGTAASTNDLTPTDAFGDESGCTNVDSCDDLDDFHGMASQPASFYVGEGPGGETLAFAFAIDAEVTYIDDDGQPTDDRTWTKQVTLIIDQVPEADGRKFLIDPVLVRRQFSHQPGS